MKDELKKIFEEEPSEDWEKRVLARADAILDEKAAAGESWLERLWKPAFGLGLAAAACAAVVVYVNRGEQPETLAVAEDTEMVRDADMLLDLSLLRDWPAVEKLEKKREWKKKKG